MQRGGGCVDGMDPRVCMGRTQDLRTEHAGQAHVDRKARGSGHLRTAVLPGDRFADHREFRIWRERRRLIGRKLARHLAKANTRYTGRKGFGARDSIVYHHCPFCAAPAASIAATT